MRTGIAVSNSAMPHSVRVGEGPHWDHQAGLLHWVDILAGSVHTTDARAGHTDTITVPTLVGAAVPRLTGGFVLATQEGFASVDGSGALDTRQPILESGLRMNDAKCDRHGRLWAGSTDMDFAPGRGKLHVLLPDWSTHVVLDGLTLPNGLGWSLDRQTFYLIDTIEAELYAFDIRPIERDLHQTDLLRRRVLFRFPADMGMPDGLTVDSAGCLWVAMWGGGRVVRISPDGELLAEIELPVAQPSSCAFGGERLEVLYVTSAREGLSLADDSTDGSVLALEDVGATGLPGEAFDG